MPLRSIFVGLDGSKYSDAAADLALNWARRFDAAVAAIGVIDKPTIRSPQSEPVAGVKVEEQLESEYVKEARHDVEAFLEDFAGRCNKAEVNCKLIEATGQVFQQILVEAERYDLTVLGKETNFHFEDERNPDKTLNRALKASPRPVVAVPDKNGRDKSGIIVAYDGSAAAARALQFLVGAGLHHLGDVYILSVEPSSPKKANDNIERVEDFLRYHNVSCHGLPVVSSGDVGKILVEQAEKNNVEVIMMGAFGRTTMTEMIFGSVTKHVMKNSPVPVFLAN